MGHRCCDARLAERLRASAPTWQQFGGFIFLCVCIALIILAMVEHKRIIQLLQFVQTLGLWGNVLIVGCLCVVALPVAAGYTPLCIGAGFIFKFWEGYATAWVGACLLGPPVGYWTCYLFWQPFIQRWLFDGVPGNRGAGGGDDEDGSSSSEGSSSVHARLLGHGSTGDMLTDSNSRLVARPAPPTVSKRKLQARAFLLAVQGNGFAVCFLLRNTPIPYGLQNALFSVSSINFWKYYAASIVGQMPELAAWVYLGSTTRKISELVGGAPSTIEIVVVTCEIGMCFAVIVFMAVLGKRALRRAEQNDAAVHGPSSSVQ